MATHWKAADLRGVENVAPFVDAMAPLTDPTLIDYRPSEREYVETALAFSSYRMPQDLDHAFDAWAHFSGGVRVAKGGPTRRPHFEESYGPAFAEITESWRQRLAIAFGDSEAARGRLAREVLPSARRVSAIPMHRVTAGGSVDTTWIWFPADLDAALSHVLLLLLDKSKPYRNDLCHCGFGECGRYFLAVYPETGRPRRDFCTKDHFQAYRRATAAARMADYRARKRNAPKAKRRAKS